MTTTAFFPIVRKAVVIVIAVVAAGMLCCSRIQAAELPFLGVVTSQTLNVRSGQSTNFEKVGTLAEGEQVIVVDQSYGWYKVKLPANADSYLSADFVKILGDGIGEATGNRVNIRSRPMVGSTVLGQVERGTLVRVLGEPQPGWLQIEPIDESYGWVSEEFVRFASADLPAPRAVQLPVKNIYVKERQAAEKAAQQAAAEQQAQAARQEAERQKNLLRVQGIVISSGDLPAEADVRHQLLVDGQPKYFLRGYRRIFDIFLQNKVDIEGELQPDAAAPLPVVFVKTIKFVL